jgi:hypothetical protein
MNDNYLWDRSGEPDAEIQQLEELLGTLRYQPRPLKIPEHFPIGRRANYFRPLAIAAGLLLFAVAISFWINFKRHSETVAVKSAPRTEKVFTPQPPATVSQGSQGAAVDQVPRRERKPIMQRAVFTASRPRKSLPEAPALTSEELAQKNQVLVALRLVSTKLNVAQRKLQGGATTNAIRNQHKIG